MAVPFDVQRGASVDFLVRKNDVNVRQITKTNVLQGVARANPQLGRRAGAKTDVTRFLKDLVTGSQRHSAADVAKQNDHKREQCIKRTRRDAIQDARILAVGAENRKEKMEKRLGVCAR
jgi:hypothetical protein